jgi:hypothetical protein
MLMIRSTISVRTAKGKRIEAANIGTEGMGIDHA